MLPPVSPFGIGQTKLSLWPKVSILSAIILLGACGGSDDTNSGVVKPTPEGDNNQDPEESDPEESDPEESDPEAQDYNLATRSGSQAFYEDFYLASNTGTTNWSGNTASCDAGSIDADLRDKGMMRLNYFRLLAGVDAVEENASLSAQAQEGALVSHRAIQDGQAFSSTHHSPPASWSCFSQDALNANSHGNLAYSGSLNSNSGYPIADAVNGFIWDHGPSNGSVGHRNNMLSSGLGAVGLGATKHIVVQMLDQALTNDNREGWWAWPAANVYVPNQVLYAGNYLLNNPRWSLRHESAFINWASKENNGGHTPTVEVMDCNGQSLDVNNIIIDNNYHLVWDVDVDYLAIEDECTFTVTVENYWLRPDENSNGTSGELTEFVYETTVFNPQ